MDVLLDSASRPLGLVLRKAVFEAVETLAQTPEGESFTFGLSYVRASDAAASAPELKTITARNVGD